jgi:hypothetical protein
VCEDWSLARGTGGEASRRVEEEAEVDEEEEERGASAAAVISLSVARAGEEMRDLSCAGEGRRSAALLSAELMSGQRTQQQLRQCYSTGQTIHRRAHRPSPCVLISGSHEEERKWAEASELLRSAMLVSHVIPALAPLMVTKMRQWRLSCCDQIDANMRWTLTVWVPGSTAAAQRHAAHRGCAVICLLSCGETVRRNETTARGSQRPGMSSPPSRGPVNNPRRADKSPLVVILHRRVAASSSCSMRPLVHTYPRRQRAGGR